MLALSDDCFSDPKTTKRAVSCCDFDWQLKCRVISIRLTSFVHFVSEPHEVVDFSPASNSLNKYLPAVGHCDGHVVRTWLMGLVSLIDLVVITPNPLFSPMLDSFCSVILLE